MRTEESRLPGGMSLNPLPGKLDPFQLPPKKKSQETQNEHSQNEYCFGGARPGALRLLWLAALSCWWGE
jgi:hypothetical protein